MVRRVLPRHELILPAERRSKRRIYTFALHGALGTDGVG
jgi:hypothetical protein